MSLTTKHWGTCLVVQWLKLHTSFAGGSLDPWLDYYPSCHVEWPKQPTNQILLSVKYTLDFKVLALKKSRTFYDYFIKIPCWNDTVFDMSGKINFVTQVSKRKKERMSSSWENLMKLPSVMQLVSGLAGIQTRSMRVWDCQCSKRKRLRFSPWVGKIPWKRAWKPTPVFLPGESRGQRSLMGYSQ